MNKKLAIIFLLLIMTYTVVLGQTNIVYNVYNAPVTIINNIVSSPRINPPIISKQSIINNNTNRLQSMTIPIDFGERLQWDQMLEQRRQAAFGQYLRSFQKNP